MRICDVNGNVLVVELPCKSFELGSRGDENDLRFQSDDAFNARMHRVANLCNVFASAG